MSDPAPRPQQARSPTVYRCDAPRLDSLHRYLALSGKPMNASVLGPLVSREIQYRLANAPFGGMMGDLIRHDSYASAIARAIAEQRRGFRAPLEITLSVTAAAFEVGYESAGQFSRDYTRHVTKARHPPLTLPRLPFPGSPGGCHSGLRAARPKAQAVHEQRDHAARIFGACFASGHAQAANGLEELGWLYVRADLTRSGAGREQRA